jgi:C-terminal processing protease CtpA/Prc
MLSPSNVDAMVSKVKNSSAVIIDLRGNRGGAIETLTSLAGSFTDQPYEMQSGSDETRRKRLR